MLRRWEVVQKPWVILDFLYRGEDTIGAIVHLLRSMTRFIESYDVVRELTRLDGV